MVNDIRKVEDHVKDAPLDLLEAAVNLQRDQFIRLRGRARLAVKRLYQRDPVVTVCADAVLSQWVVAALFLILWLLRIRSKSKIRVCHLGSSTLLPPVVHCHGKACTSESYPASVEEKRVILLVMDYLLAVVRQRLIMSGDVELNPGPLDQGKNVQVYIDTLCISSLLQYYV